MAARDYGQSGGIARAVELIGERWALLIVRDLLVGPRRYGELAEGLHKIPTNILATRLKELQAAGIVRRAPRSRVIVYELTDYGRELEPIVLALDAWGLRALGEPRDEQVLTPDALAIDLRAAFRAGVARTLPSTVYSTRLGDSGLLVRVDGGSLDVARESGAADVTFAFGAGAGIRLLLRGDLAPERALADGLVAVSDGAPDLLERFARTFRLAA